MDQVCAVSGAINLFFMAAAARQLLEAHRDAAAAGTASAFLAGFEMRDYGTDVVSIEANFRHVRVPGDDPFAQRFLQPSTE